MTQLFYDDRDRAAHERQGSRILDWLEELGGPGTAHEQIFKSVAARLQGRDAAFAGDGVGGMFGE